MVILPGITNSWTRIHRRNSHCAGIYRLIDEEFTGRMVISPGISNSGMTNPQEEWETTGNYQLRDEKSTQGIGFRRE
jgi:hypothetical protein